MTRKEIAERIFGDYQKSLTKSYRMSGVLVWVGRRGSWGYTPNTSAIMSNNGHNILITEDMLRDMWAEPDVHIEKKIKMGHLKGRKKFILILDYFLKMIWQKEPQRLRSKK